MALFGAVLDNAVLALPGGGIGGTVAPAAVVDIALASNAPTVAAGKSVLVAAPVDLASASGAPSVLTGKNVAITAPTDLISGVGAPDVATSAHVTLAAGADIAAAPQAPVVGSSALIAPASPVNAASESGAPAVATGKLVAPASPANLATANNAPLVVVSATVSPVTLNLIATPNVPIISTGINIVVGTRNTSTDGGCVLEGAVLGFAVLVGPTMTAITTAAGVNLVFDPHAPAILTGKNVIPFAPVNIVSASNTPDIDTERRRRTVQAIAS